MKANNSKQLNPIALAKVAGAGAFATLLLCVQAQAASLVYEIEGLVDANPAFGTQSVFDVGTGTTTSIAGDTYRLSLFADTTLVDELPTIPDFGQFSGLSATIEFSSIATVFNLDDPLTLFEANAFTTSNDELVIIDPSATSVVLFARLPDGTLGDLNVLNAFAPVDSLEGETTFSNASANGGTSLINFKNDFSTFDDMASLSARLVVDEDIPEPSVILGSIFAACVGATVKKKKQAA